MHYRFTLHYPSDFRKRRKSLPSISTMYSKCRTYPRTRPFLPPPPLPPPSSSLPVVPRQYAAALIFRSHFSWKERRLSLAGRQAGRHFTAGDVSSSRSKSSGRVSRRRAELYGTPSCCRVSSTWRRRLLWSSWHLERERRSRRKRRKNRECARTGREDCIRSGPTCLSLLHSQVEGRGDQRVRRGNSMVTSSLFEKDVALLSLDSLSLVKQASSGTALDITWDKRFYRTCW